MNPTVVAIIGLVSIALAVPVQADHGCNGTVTTIGAGAQTLYLDDRSREVTERSHWLYLESNGLPGLQSGGAIDPIPESIEPEFRDPCGHSNPDLLMATSSEPW